MKSMRIKKYLKIKSNRIEQINYFSYNSLNEFPKNNGKKKMVNM